MSLFGGLFAANGAGTSSLFGANSAFRRDAKAEAKQPPHPTTEVAASADAPAKKGLKKRSKSAAPASADDAPEPAAAKERKTVKKKSKGSVGGEAPAAAAAEVAPKKRKKAAAQPADDVPQSSPAADAEAGPGPSSSKARKVRRAAATEEVGAAAAAPPAEPAAPAPRKKARKAATPATEPEGEEAPPPAARAAKAAGAKVPRKKAAKAAAEPADDDAAAAAAKDAAPSTSGAAAAPSPAAAPLPLRRRGPKGKADADSGGESEEEDMRSKAQVLAAKKKQLTPEEKATRDAANLVKLTRTLFVGNLPIATTPKQLKQIFTKLGFAVESARLRSLAVDPDVKIPRRSAILTGQLRDTGAFAAGGVNGYVVLEDADDMEKALDANMSEFNGHHIRVDRASAPRKAAGEGSAADPGGMPAIFDVARSVFVGNIDFMVKDEDVIAFFNASSRGPELSGSVEAVRLVRDKATNIGKGFGFVLFRTKVAARAALALNGQKLNKRDMRITRATQQAASRPASTFRPTLPGSAPTTLKRPYGELSVASSRPTSEWQGTQTKGKGAGVRGPRVHGDGAGHHASTAASAGARAAPALPAHRLQSGKRPAVAARKQAQSGAQGAQAAAGPPMRRGGGFKGPSGSGAKKGGVKKPRWVPRTGGGEA